MGCPSFRVASQGKREIYERRGTGRPKLRASGGGRCIELGPKAVHRSSEDGAKAFGVFILTAVSVAFIFKKNHYPREHSENGVPKFRERGIYERRDTGTPNLRTRALKGTLCSEVQR